MTQQFQMECNLSDLLLSELSEAASAPSLFFKRYFGDIKLKTFFK